MALSVQEQINICLNCKKNPDLCKGKCDKLKNSVVHRRSHAEIDEQILKHFDHCAWFVDLVEATGIDKTTLRRHCKWLGLDLSRFRRNKGHKRIIYEQ